MIISGRILFATEAQRTQRKFFIYIACFRICVMLRLSKGDLTRFVGIPYMLREPQHDILTINDY